MDILDFSTLSSFVFFLFFVCVSCEGPGWSSMEVHDGVADETVPVEADETTVGDVRVVVDETTVGNVCVVADETTVGEVCVVATVGDTQVVADETIRVGDVHVVADETCVVATMGESVVVDEMGKGVGVASGVDALVSSWCSPLVLARLDVSKSTGGFETARLPITPCISANHLKLTNIS